MAGDGRGPYTIDDLLRFWLSTVDASYAQPFVQALKELGVGVSIDAGEDEADTVDSDQPTLGLEVFSQQMAQAKRVSEAVERTLEGMFIMPWSGQIDQPAQEEAYATVTLWFSRSKLFEKLVTFPAGFVVVEEVEVDDGDPEGIDRATGRLFILRESLTFMPGEMGPKEVQAIAEKPGYGYNNPRPGSLRGLVQIGAGLTNSSATVIAGTVAHELQVGANPDVVAPQNVGQYIEFFQGANIGRMARIIGYRAPDTGIPHGGVAVLARTTLLRVSAVIGTPRVGEEFTQATTGAVGKFVALSGDLVVVESADSLWAATFAATGAETATSFMVDKVEQDSTLASEVASAGWRVLRWAEDLGFEVTNDDSPQGGRAAMLDALGRERNIDRATGEADAVYRKRIHQLPDVVSPNAIRRTANRILNQVGASVLLRETETDLLPGFYADVDASDYDFVVRPQDKWKVALSYEEFRAFFLLGVPRLSLGEFGAFYDDSPYSFYDDSPYPAFFDGFPLQAAIIYMAIWAAVNKARAGGVGFDLVIEE